MSRHVRAKPLVTNPFRRGHRRWKVVVLAAAAIALLVFARPTALSAALGLPVIVAGLGIRLWAAGHLTKTRELTLSGPYRYVRNPLYLGTLLIVVGFCVFAGKLVAAVALPVGLGVFFGYYFPRKERIETARLEEIYGERYRAYRDAVPALVPLLHPWSPGGPGGEPAPPLRWRFGQVRDNSELGPSLVVALALTVVLVLHAF